MTGDPRKILIAHNPKAGAVDRDELLRGLIQRLEAAGLEPALVADLDALQTTVERWHANGELRLVVAAGGDGTVAAVAQRVPADTCLAVFPLGTENLLAKWLGATLELEPFVQAVMANRRCTIDAARANDKLALITIGIGFDAEVVRRMQARRTGHITKWSYLGPIWQTFWAYRFPTLTVTATKSAAAGTDANAGQPQVTSPPQTWTVHWLFVANLPNYGGGLSFAPRAIPSDGWLDVAMFRRGGRWRGLGYAWRLFMGSLDNCRDFTGFRTTALKVESTAEVGFQVDGDFGGNLPLRIELLPNRVCLLRFD